MGEVRQWILGPLGWEARCSKTETGPMGEDRHYLLGPLGWEVSLVSWPESETGLMGEDRHCSLGPPGWGVRCSKTETGLMVEMCRECLGSNVTKLSKDTKVIS